jgi:exopolyphosphatase / guanosine-5'-triphosphate,3'-diphosphate pyrophosphatase
VIDVGGGSTQLMVGTAEEPARLHCLDIGSLRLTARHLEHDPPTAADRKLGGVREGAVLALLDELAPSAA